jgi:hypothetical protein
VDRSIGDAPRVAVRPRRKREGILWAPSKWLYVVCRALLRDDELRPGAQFTARDRQGFVERVMRARLRVPVVVSGRAGCWWRLAPSRQGGWKTLAAGQAHARRSSGFGRQVFVASNLDTFVTA